MTHYVRVPLSPETYERVRQWAEGRRQTVADAIADLLADALPVDPPEDGEPELDPAVERERAAYVALHPRLKQTHFGRFVAIYGGELVDEDDEYGPLVERIIHRYPEQFVWLTQVAEQPLHTLSFRSPRLVRELK